MRYHPKGTLSNPGLALLAICAIGLLWGVEISKYFVQDPIFEEKIAAARLTQKAMTIIKTERLKKGIPIDPETDPNGTGLVGAEYTDLTTTLGSLASKRTSTNPNFAGVVVDLLHRAGVKPEDRVAVSLSGSFPALNVALLSTVQILRLQPVIISSLGASAYGANHPDLTWLDMERVLRDRGIFSYASKAASLGGISGTGGGLGEQGIALALEAMQRNGIPPLEEGGLATLERDMERRLAVYDKELDGKKPAAFINIGGALTSVGDCRDPAVFPTGLVVEFRSPPCNRRGLLFRMSESGVPVIHLLNIRQMAIRYGLPIDPVPLPGIPSGGIMRPARYSLFVTLTGLSFLLLIFFARKTVDRISLESSRRMLRGIKF